MKPEISKLLAEQQTYYAERAPEYDEWWARAGRYDLGPEGNRRWQNEVGEVTRFFESYELRGQALDVAAGTGTWTEFLARHTDEVTAVDGSQEVLAVNRQRLTNTGLIDRVTYQQVDLFSWSPSRCYDLVFMGFWISHVPHSLMEEFLSMLSGTLATNGRVLLIDSRVRSDNPRQGTQTISDDIELRTLNDGRQSRIVKRFHSPDELTKMFARHGIDATLKNTSQHFTYGVGSKN